MEGVENTPPPPPPHAKPAKKSLVFIGLKSNKKTWEILEIYKVGMIKQN